MWWASPIPGANVTPFYIAGFWVALIMLAWPVFEAEWRDWQEDRKKDESNNNEEWWDE